MQVRDTITKKCKNCLRTEYIQENPPPQSIFYDEESHKLNGLQVRFNSKKKSSESIVYYCVKNKEVPGKS